MPLQVRRISSVVFSPTLFGIKKIGGVARDVVARRARETNGRDRLCRPRPSPSACAAGSYGVWLQANSTYAATRFPSRTRTKTKMRGRSEVPLIRSITPVSFACAIQ